MTASPVPCVIVLSLWKPSKGAAQGFDPRRRMRDWFGQAKATIETELPSIDRKPEAEGV